MERFLLGSQKATLRVMMPIFAFNLTLGEITYEEISLL